MKFAIPSIIAMLTSALYNIVDQFFIGHSVGDLGNAATNLAFPLTTSCIAIALPFIIWAMPCQGCCFGAVLLAMIIIFFLHITVHEAGHLGCGLLTGYRFCSYRIGSLMLIKTNGQFKLKQYALPGTGGQCLMAPPDMADGKMPYMLYHLGGCLFNLLFSLLAFLFSLFCREGRSDAAFLAGDSGNRYYYGSDQLSAYADVYGQ